ncbi:MAG: hypothetical protein GYA43_01165, partial [Bacteroidales bacterium]|nr:hypothetical protein [Bacteroidales bacterium]
MKKTIWIAVISFIVFLLPFFTLAAQEGEHATHPEKTHSGSEAEKGFNSSEFIMDHISDSHEWHIMTLGNGRHVVIYLPVILWSKEKGLSVFSSRKLAHGHIHNDYMLVEEGELKGRIV